MRKNKNKEQNNITPLLFPTIIIIYSISVLFIDLLISFNANFIIHWGVFKLNLTDLLLKIPILKNFSFVTLFEYFDLYKFLFWLIIPFILFNKFIDFKWWSIKRWQKRDYILFSFFFLICFSSLIFVILSPTLQKYYPGMSTLPPKQKILISFQQIFWIISWLPGWEFLNRHLLLRACGQFSKRYGWFLVTVVETLYHISKALLEILGMFIFSFIACIWSQRKEDNLMAFLCHLIIEIGLIFILMIT